MRGAKISLAVGLTVCCSILVLICLSVGPERVLATNSVAEEGALTNTPDGTVRICQTDERIPRGTTAISGSLEAFTGPSLDVTVTSGSKVLAEGTLGSGWSGRSIPISVREVRRSYSPAKVCFSSHTVIEPIAVVGDPQSRLAGELTSNGKRVTGHIRVDYLRRGEKSWLARAGSIVTDMGRGRAWSGGWVAPFVIVLMMAAAALASLQTLRSSDERPGQE